jgi:predicted DCC family thiol-disulfide oxidoreductase YuxK
MSEEITDIANIEHPIVFYDGVCVMCDSFINKVMKADKAGIFRFAPLQGDTAKKLLPPLPADHEQWSVICLDRDGMVTGSDASLSIARRLGGWWGVLAWTRIVPHFIREGVYRFIARHRYRAFGQLEACPMPTPDRQARMLP